MLATQHTPIFTSNEPGYRFMSSPCSPSASTSGGLTRLPPNSSGSGTFTMFRSTDGDEEDQQRPSSSDPPLQPMRLIASTCSSGKTTDLAPSWSSSTSNLPATDSYLPPELRRGRAGAPHSARLMEDGGRLWPELGAVLHPPQAPIGSERKRILSESVCDFSGHRSPSPLREPAMMTIDEFRSFTQQARVKNPHAPRIMSMHNPIRERVPMKVWAYLLQEEVDGVPEIDEEGVYARQARRAREEFLTRQYRNALASPTMEKRRRVAPSLRKALLKANYEREIAAEMSMDIVLPDRSNMYTEPVLGIDLGREFTRTREDEMVVDVTTPESFARQYGYEYDPNSPAMLMCPVLSDSGSDCDSLSEGPSTPTMSFGKLQFVEDWKMDLDQDDDADDWRSRVPDSPRIRDADSFDEF